ncbi:MAG: hypothetical protein V3R64_09690 [Sphingomonadales bacterium]
MKIFAILVFLCFATETLAQDFEEGQAWSYQTRDHEPDSRLLIYKIDEFPEGTKIFSIVITNVGLKIPTSEVRMQTFIAHIPITETGLKSSVLEEVETFDPYPETSEGYDNWKTAFEKGTGGVFELQIKEIIGVIEATMGNGKIDP